jgi:hypothetical protein
MATSLPPRGETDPASTFSLDLLLAAQMEFCRETVASLCSFAAAAFQAQNPVQLVALQAGLLAGMTERSLLLGRKTMLLALGAPTEVRG